MKRILRRINDLSLPIKCSVAYVLASLLTNGLSIITTPLFTRVMSSADMGLVTTFGSWQTMLGSIITLSLNSGVFSVAMVEFKNERDSYISSIFALSSFSTLCSSLVFLLFLDKFSFYLGISENLIILMLVGCLLLPATNYWMARQRFEYKYKPVLLVSCISAIISTATSILFVLLAKEKDCDLGSARLFGKLLPQYLLAFFIAVSICKKGKILFNKKYWVFALKLGVPLIIHTLAKQVLDVSDRVMIDFYVGKSAVGIYGVLYSVSTLASIVWSAINSSLIPKMFQLLSDKQGDKIKTLIQPIILVYAVACIILAIFSPEIVSLLATEEYYAAIYIVPPISAGIFFTSVYTVYGNVLLYYKKSVLVMLATVIAAIINVILNAIFIPNYGFVAAAYTTLVSYIVLALVQNVMVQKINHQAVFTTKFLITAICCVVLWCCICNLLYNNNIARWIFIGIVFVLLLALRNKLKDVISALIKKK